MGNVKRGTPVLSAGTEFAWAVETTKNVMPTSARFIPDIKTIPDMSVQPDKIETTDLSCTKYKTHENGLIDLSGVSAFVSNVTPLLEKEWEDMYNAYETAKSAGLRMWFYVITPALKTSAFPGEPGTWPIAGRDVNQIITGNLNITVSGEPILTSETITVTYPSE